MSAWTEEVEIAAGALAEAFFRIAANNRVRTPSINEAAGRPIRSLMTYNRLDYGYLGSALHPIVIPTGRTVFRALDRPERILQNFHPKLFVGIVEHMSRSITPALTVVMPMAILSMIPLLIETNGTNFVAFGFNIAAFVVTTLSLTITVALRAVDFSLEPN